MYDYEKLKEDIEKLNPVAAEKMIVGKSVMGRDIFCIKTGRGKRKIVLTGAHHGLEYITSLFLMRFAGVYTHSVIRGEEMFGRDVRRLFCDNVLYIVPMVNPDGVDIAVNGLDITNEFHRALISKVGIHSFRKVWQANANGVDLNHNYDALWSRVVEKPAPSLYGGEFPESEPETKALCSLIRDVNADMLVCFHSQGEEIYYDFDGMEEECSKQIAERMASVSGYGVAKPEGSASFGGCKDWFIKEFRKPGFTIEMGKGKNPLPDNVIDRVFDENARIILECMCYSS